MSQTSQETKKSRGPGLRQDRSISTCRDRSRDKFSTNKKVGDLVSDLSATWSPTSRRPGLRQDRSNGIWASAAIVHWCGMFLSLCVCVIHHECCVLSVWRVRRRSEVVRPMRRTSTLPRLPVPTSRLPPGYMSPTTLRTGSQNCSSKMLRSECLSAMPWRTLGSAWVMPTIKIKK